MNTVSKWGMALFLTMISTPTFAAGTNQIFSEGTFETYGTIEVEHIVSRHSLATYMGLSKEDAIFANPRSFHSESLNSDHFDLDPLPADAEDGAGS